ncbi:hypothetical protein JHK86_009834 [Glycine max]|nr:hypothetical protein JHK86_009834 [Glycine max]
MRFRGTGELLVGRDDEGRDLAIEAEDERKPWLVELRGQIHNFHSLFPPMRSITSRRAKEITGSGIFVANGEDEALEDGVYIYT